MLHALYTQVGLLWTLAAGLALVLTSFTWILAIAGASSLPMSKGVRFAVLAMLTLIPPSAIFYMAYAAVQIQRDYDQL